MIAKSSYPNIKDPGDSPAQPLTHEQIIDGVVATLGDLGVLAGSGPTPWNSFISLSDLVHRTYKIPSTTFTGTMRRLVFALGLAAAPRNIVGVGTFVGYAFTWLLRNRSDPTSAPFLQSALGFDVVEDSTALASRNCKVLGHGERLQFRTEDGVKAVRHLTHPIDLLYIDLDDPETGKADYKRVAEQALPHLRAGAVILAHDACVPRFKDDFKTYHDFVRASGAFAGSWVLPVDECGLSLALVA